MKMLAAEFAVWVRRRHNITLDAAGKYALIRRSLPKRSPRFHAPLNVALTIVKVLSPRRETVRTIDRHFKTLLEKRESRFDSRWLVEIKSSSARERVVLKQSELHEKIHHSVFRKFKSAIDSVRTSSVRSQYESEERRSLLHWVEKRRLETSHIRWIFSISASPKTPRAQSRAVLPLGESGTTGRVTVSTSSTFRHDGPFPALRASLSDALSIHISRTFSRREKMTVSGLMLRRSHIDAKEILHVRGGTLRPASSQPLAAATAPLPDRSEPTRPVYQTKRSDTVHLRNARARRRDEPMAAAVGIAARQGDLDERVVKQIQHRILEETRSLEQKLIAKVQSTEEVTEEVYGRLMRQLRFEKERLGY